MQNIITTPGNIFAKIAKITGGLTVILVGIKVIGFVEKLVLADYFGTKYQMDAYMVVLSLMLAFWGFCQELMSPTYLPTLMAYRDEAGEEQSWEFTSSVLNLMGLILLALILGSLLFTPQLITLLAPGFLKEQVTIPAGFSYATVAFDSLGGKRFVLAIGLTRLMLTGAGFFAIAIVTGLTLNSYKRFYLAIADDVVFKVSEFLGLIILARYIGIYGMAWGVAMGSWVAPVIHLIGMRKQLPFYRLIINFKLKPLKRMGQLMLPLLVGTICIQSRPLIDNWFASGIGIGKVAAIGFAYKLIDFAYTAVAKPLAVVVLPYFSDLAQQDDHEKLTETVITTLRTVVLIFTPLMICLFVLRYPVIRLLFERGKFDADSTQLTATALTFYALGLVSFAVDVILLRVYYSLSDTTTPAIMEAATIGLHIGIIWLFIGSLGHGSIALAFTLSKTLKVIILFALLERKLPIQIAQNIKFLGKIALAAGGTFCLLTLYHQWLASFLSASSVIHGAFLVGSGGGLGILAFFLLALALKIDEVHVIIQSARKYITH